MINYMKAMEQALEIKKIIVDFLSDWDQSMEIECELPDTDLTRGWTISITNPGRDQILEIFSPDGEAIPMLGEQSMMMLGSILMWQEELGWVDLDAYAWDAKVETLWHDDETEQDGDFKGIKLTLQCTDWAS